MSKKKSIGFKKRIFEIIQIGNKSDFPSLFFDIFISVVIVLNVVITFMQTFDQLEKFSAVFSIFEWITIVIFLVEYLLRVWTAQYLYPKLRPDKAKIKFVTSFYGIIDLLTILPFILPFFLPSGVVAFRMFRVVRIFHLFRVNSHYDALNVIVEVIKEKRNQLVSSIFLILTLMVAASLCMYSLEHDAQPENFSNAFSGIWWSVSTLLTVGYGDIYPITAIGKMVAIVIAFLGVGAVAVPTGIISAGFVEYYTRLKIGTYAQHEADFILLKLSAKHPFKGKKVQEIVWPEGIYAAVIFKNNDVVIPDPEVVLEEGDSIMLGTEENPVIDCDLDEIEILEDHPWIGYRVKDLDISRRSYVIMIKRKDKNMRPTEDTVIKKGDCVLVLQKHFRQ